MKHGVEGSFVTMSDGQCMKHFAIGILPGMWQSIVPFGIYYQEANVYLGLYQLITFRFILFSLLLCTLCVLSMFLLMFYCLDDNDGY